MGHRLRWLRRSVDPGPSRIVDAHACDVPAWRKLPGLFRDGRGRPGPPPAEPAGASLSDLIGDMDRARVRASLVALDEEPEEFLRLAQQYPGRLFGLAYYDSLSPRRGLERVRALCHDHPGLILGVTTAMPRFHQDPRLKDFVPLYEYCGARGLPVQFHAEGDPPDEGAGHPTALAVLARTYPGLTVIGQHTERWPPQALEHLGRFPNLFLLTGGVPGAGSPQEGAVPSLLAVLRATGGRKLLFGSGWRGREAGYLQRVEAVRRLPWPARRHIGWRTAVRVYGSRILSPPSGLYSQPSSR